MSATTPAGRPGRHAARRERTRRRIVEATVELHTTVGPARTTISAIAERAGVQRHTVYAHFPDEEALFGACTALWTERNPYPHAAAWARIDDPRERLAVALEEVYAWLDRSGDDLITVAADAARVPSMAAAAAREQERMREVVAVLARGWGVRGRRRVRLLAAIGHALQPMTWRTLVTDGGLGRDEAVELLATLVAAAAGRLAEPG